MMNDTSDELRIIAKDAVLCVQDRETIRRAADEYDMTMRALIAVQAALVESQARHIAVNDRLIEALRVRLAGTVSFKLLPSMHA